MARYRLFEIDRFISRTVSYAVISAVLVGLYVAAVIGLGAIVRKVAAFSGRLRSGIALDDLAVDLLATVRTSVQPDRASLWLRARGVGQ